MTKIILFVCLAAALWLTACSPTTQSAATPSPVSISPTPAIPVSPTVAPSPTAASLPTLPVPTAEALYPPAVQAARSALARDQAVPLNQVTVVIFTPVEWRNGCLEVDRDERPCTDAIVPGYRVILSVDGQLFEYRTNLDGSQVVFAGPDVGMPPPSTVALTWYREGGFAGLCDELRVLDSGEAVAGNCQRGSSIEVGRSQLLPAEKDQLDTWLTTLAPVNDTLTDAAKVDAITQTLALAGRGQVKASPADLETMYSWAATLHARIVSDIER